MSSMWVVCVIDSPSYLIKDDGVKNLVLLAKLSISLVKDNSSCLLILNLGIVAFFSPLFVLEVNALCVPISLIIFVLI